MALSDTKQKQMLGIKLAKVKALRTAWQEEEKTKAKARQS